VKGGCGIAHSKLTVVVAANKATNEEHVGNIPPLRVQPNVSQLKTHHKETYDDVKYRYECDGVTVKRPVYVSKPYVQTFSGFDGDKLRMNADQALPANRTVFSCSRDSAHIFYKPNLPKTSSFVGRSTKNSSFIKPAAAASKIHLDVLSRRTVLKIR